MFKRYRVSRVIKWLFLYQAIIEFGHRFAVLGQADEDYDAESFQYDLNWVYHFIFLMSQIDSVTIVAILKTALGDYDQGVVPGALNECPEIPIAPEKIEPECTYDQESGHYHFRARAYDPFMGRFLQTDPLGYVDSMNLYQAFNMNPFNFTDPMGMETAFTSWYVNAPMWNQHLPKHLQVKTIQDYVASDAAEDMAFVENLAKIGLAGLAAPFASALPAIVNSTAINISLTYGPTALYMADRGKAFLNNAARFSSEALAKVKTTLPKVAEYVNHQTTKAAVKADTTLSAAGQYITSGVQHAQRQYVAASNRMDVAYDATAKAVNKVSRYLFNKRFDVRITGESLKESVEGFIQDNMTPLPAIGKNVAKTVGAIANQVLNFVNRFQGEASDTTE